jgi:TAG lipase/steryl ester hydrolase/phospholipase A2/LPA acyltransferase
MLTYGRAVSCSVPVVFSPPVLVAKDPLTGETVPWHDDRRQWIDGSVDGDLPMTRLAEMFNVNHFIVSQVNPHVVPFLAKEDGPGGNTNRQPWLSSPWLSSITNLARDEALHRMAVLSEMGIFATEFTKAASILSQQYSGDINIFPEISYAHFPRILQNPTTEFMLQACLSGERATWPRIARIRNHVAIELALDSAVQTMRARVALSPAVASGLGIHIVTNRSRHSFDEGRDLSRRASRRRSSYSHGSERGKSGRPTSSRRPSVLLKKARSTISIGCVPQERPVSPVARQKESRASFDRRLSFETCRNIGDSSFTVGGDSDDESTIPSFARRPPPSPSATWAASVIRPLSPRSTRSSPVTSRRSSVAKGVSLPLRPHAVDVAASPNAKPT